MLVGRACGAGAEQMSALTMNSALRGRGEAVGVAYIPRRPSQEEQGSFSEPSQCPWLLNDVRSLKERLDTDKVDNQWKNTQKGATEQLSSVRKTKQWRLLTGKEFSYWLPLMCVCVCVHLQMVIMNLV